MSIAKLSQLARLDLPLNVKDDDEIDELRVLMAAGLIAALTLRMPLGEGAHRERMALVVRVLAITPEGYRLLRRSGAGTGDPAAY